MKVKRTYIPYWDWEDFKNGMWNRSVANENELIELAFNFTGDWSMYGSAMGEVIKAWPNTMLNSLTNTAINRRAFLGHCAVNYKISIPEYITRIAWGMLTDKQRFDADKIAQWHINNYERQNFNVHKRMGKQMLFQWPSG